MIEPIADMPAGTLGFRASGKLSSSDYAEIAIPPLREAIEHGEKIRLLYQIGPGFDGLAAGAMWEDIKSGLGLGFGHLSAWERTAMVSDEDWLRQMIAVFGWMSPGELRLFPLDEMEAAKEWVAG